MTRINLHQLAHTLRVTDQAVRRWERERFLPGATRDSERNVYWTLAALEQRFGPDFDPSSRLLNKGEVANLVGVSRSTLDRRLGASGFPGPWLIHGKTVRWLKADVERWQTRYSQE